MVVYTPFTEKRNWKCRSGDRLEHTSRVAGRRCKWIVIATLSRDDRGRRRRGGAVGPFFVGKVEGSGDGPVGHSALVDVDALGDAGVAGRDASPAVLCKLEHIGKGDVAERVR